VQTPPRRLPFAALAALLLVAAGCASGPAAAPPSTHVYLWSSTRTADNGAELPPEVDKVRCTSHWLDPDGVFWTQAPQGDWGPVFIARATDTVQGATFYDVRVLPAGGVADLDYVRVQAVGGVLVVSGKAVPAGGAEAGSANYTVRDGPGFIHVHADYAFSDLGVHEWRWQAPPGGCP
jgi:hypothetical protein